MADPFLAPYNLYSPAPGGSSYTASLPQREPDGGQAFQDRILNRARQARQQITQAAETNIPRMRAAAEKAPLGRIGTFGTAGLMGAQQLAQGNVPGAVAETGGALAGGAIASAVAKAIPGPWGMAARVALPEIGRAHV